MGKRANMANRKKKKPVSTNVNDDISHISIEPEEVFYLVQEMAKAHEVDGEASWYTQGGILADRYPKDHVRAFCITERMRCLIGMTKDKRMKGWSMDTDDPKCDLTHEAVFRATAKAPMRAKGQRLQFDPDEFFALVLTETDSEGNA